MHRRPSSPQETLRRSVAEIGLRIARVVGASEGAKHARAVEADSWRFAVWNRHATGSDLRTEPHTRLSEREAVTRIGPRGARAAAASRVAQVHMRLPATTASSRPRTGDVNDTRRRLPEAGIALHSVEAR